MDSDADVSYTNSKAASIATHGAAAGTLGQEEVGKYKYLFISSDFRLLDEILYSLLFHPRHDIDRMSFVSVPCYKLSRRWSGGQRLLL